MKKQIKAVVLALIFGTFTVNAQNHNSILSVTDRIVTGNTGEFTSYVNSKAKKVSRRNSEDLKKYVEVVNLYHNSSVAFYNLNEAQKAEFMNASANLSEKLGSMRKSEARNWAQKIQLNKTVFDFIWSSKNAGNGDFELTEVPNEVEPVTSL
ncbi:MAG: hypothetical protein IPH28_20600 [Cytophagaceae bacterium]|nr:hypothetical protein [Cytophagaceae bacterium]MBK9511207.1 hypothetical protein [Cytophagaceae bacterium]MBK9933075.1 hypothetical protein [Cytophagaceae bacterium]MBL0303207.1 hypothetical protein [Cytophagaceae bacterium]MBL0326058.1 hypothetical protein [Cytophagaceae bacterium]